MLEVAEIIRLHGAAYRAHVGDRLLPSHARVLRYLAACRTAYFGGHLTQCDHCGQPVARYHSCRNRHCTKCHGDQTERWLEAQRAQLLPCPYYLLTFTLPRELRTVAFAHQAAVYGVLMRSAAHRRNTDAPTGYARDRRGQRKSARSKRQAARVPQTLC